MSATSSAGPTKTSSSDGMAAMTAGMGPPMPSAAVRIGGDAVARLDRDRRRAR